MTRSKFILHLTTLLLVMMAVCVVGCADFDDSYGSEYTPSSQDLAYKSFDSDTCAGYNFFSTSLFKSDSIRSSNIGLAVYGVEQREGYGERRSGFFSQFVSLQELNEDDDDDWEEEWPFGYEPIFDSLMMYFTLSSFTGDTTFCQKFEVYEALNVDFLNNTMDSVYFENFDISQLNLSAEPLFTFTYPDQENYVYMSASRVRLYPTDNPQAMDFIDRLLLRDDTADNDIYDEDEQELFLEKFKGIYIKPVSQIGDDYETVDDWDSRVDSKGGTFSVYTDGSGLGLYARSRYESDPTIIKDTLILAYAFRSFSSTSLDDDYYGITINTVERSGGIYDSAIDSSVEVSTIMVEGMGGVVTQITLTPDLFELIDNELSTTVDNKGAYDYKSIFVNQARLSLYAPTDYIASYNPEDIDPIDIVDWFESVTSRLGMYSSYTDYYLTEDDYDDDESTLEGIEDYDYEYELTYSTYLPYSGSLSRSFGCYDMLISAQIQEAWNSYLEAKEDAGGDVSMINWDDVEECKFIVAPVADGLYTTRYVTLQGMDEGTNTAPMRLRLTYTLIK